VRRTVQALCRYDAIPKAFKIDVSHMDIGDVVRISEVTAPDGVELVYDNDFNVMSVYGKRGGATA
jgi:hypothetical protein